MYTRKYKTKNTAGNSADTTTSNRFAPRRFVVQPQAEEIINNLDLQTKSDKKKPSSNILPKVSVSATSITQPQPTRIQMKLTIGQPSDKYEQEADKLAADIVQRINAPESAKVQRQESTEDEDEELQRSSISDNIQCQEMPEDEDELQTKPMVQRLSIAGGMAATPDLEASIQQARSSGQPLTENIRHPMEQAFKADFSGVKIHTDAQSDQLNQSIQAKAFTTGQDIFFRQGEYQPGNRGGQELLAHELTHVVQQNGNAVQRNLNNEIATPNSVTQSPEKKPYTQPIIQRLVANEYSGQLFVPNAWLNTTLEERTQTLKDVISNVKSPLYKELIDNLNSLSGIDINEISKVSPNSEIFQTLVDEGIVPEGLHQPENQEACNKWKSTLETSLSVLNAITILSLGKTGKINNKRQQLIINPQELVKAPDDLAGGFDATKACALIAIVKSEGQNRTNLDNKLGLTQSLKNDLDYYKALHDHYYINHGIQYDEPVTSPALLNEWGFKLIFSGKQAFKDLRLPLTTGKQYIFAIEGHIVYVTMNQDLPATGIPSGKNVTDYFVFHSDRAHNYNQHEYLFDVKYIFEK